MPPDMRPLSRHVKNSSAYLSGQTIAALATAVGGAISVIRVSGARAFEALDGLAEKPVSAHAEPRRMTRARLRGKDGVELDDALFACFPSPDSFTGENVVELHLHGGGFTSARVLSALSELGVRQALPGEFSFRAVRNGKMSISQAQAVADLITASNETAVALALEKLSGAQNAVLFSLAQDLRKLAVLGEAGIDFADQDIDEVSLPSLKKRILPLLAVLEKLRSSFERGVRVQEGVSVALLGLPNAGKSSFFNALLGEDRSIVSDIPGTTRDVVREKITLHGPRGSVTLRMDDTAGLRPSEDSIEREGVTRSRAAAQAADLVILAVDPGTPAERVDCIRRIQEEWSLLGVSGEKVLGIFTKCDRLPEAERFALDLERDFSVLGLRSWLRTSAFTGEGIAEAAEKIADAASAWVSRGPREILLTRLDQVSSVSSALEHLRRAETAQAIELFAADIRQALHALGPLIGETLPDDILGKIFSEFCIGK